MPFVEGMFTKRAVTKEADGLEPLEFEQLSRCRGKAARLRTATLPQ